MANAQPTIMAMSNDSTSKPSPIDVIADEDGGDLEGNQPRTRGEAFGRSILP